MNWELGHTEPEFRHVPAIHGFLGYVPENRKEWSIGERLKGRRRALGWSQKRAAVHLGVDPTTLAKWEREVGEPRGRFANVVETWLAR